MATISVEKLFEKWMKDPKFKEEYDKLEEEFGEKMNPSDKPVQTRSEESGLNYFDTVQEALSAAENDETIWKISFKVGEERLRLVKNQIRTSLEMSLGSKDNFQWVLEGTQGADSDFGKKLLSRFET